MRSVQDDTVIASFTPLLHFGKLLCISLENCHFFIITRSACVPKNEFEVASTHSEFIFSSGKKFRFPYFFFILHVLQYGNGLAFTLVSFLFTGGLCAYSMVTLQ